MLGWVNELVREWMNEWRMNEWQSNCERKLGLQLQKTMGAGPWRLSWKSWLSTDNLVTQRWVSLSHLRVLLNRAWRDWICLSKVDKASEQAMRSLAREADEGTAHPEVLHQDLRVSVVHRKLQFAVDSIPPALHPEFHKHPQCHILGLYDLYTHVLDCILTLKSPELCKSFLPQILPTKSVSSKSVCVQW